MNRMKFNEGGQPTYLDDLKTLQDNQQEALSLLLGGLTGGTTEAYLLQPYSFDTTIEDADKGIVRLTVHANSIVVGGEIIPFASASYLNTEIEEKGVACVCLKRVESDARTFEDGQSRNCQETVSAYLSLDPTGVEEYYELPTLRSLSQLIGEQLGLSLSSTWTSVPVTFYNGYSGSVKYKISEGSAEVSIDVSSSSTEWSESPGLLFKIADSSLRSVLSGLSTGYLSGVPTNSSGEVMGYGSVVTIDSEGKCKIINRTNGGTLALGYIPPCSSGDTKGTITTTLTKQ